MIALHATGNPQFAFNIHLESARSSFQQITSIGGHGLRKRRENYHRVIRERSFHGQRGVAPHPPPSPNVSRGTSVVIAEAQVCFKKKFFKVRTRAAVTPLIPIRLEKLLQQVIHEVIIFLRYVSRELVRKVFRTPLML